MKTVQRIAIALAGAAVLLAVAASYLNPHLMLDLADKLWACF